MKTYQGTRDIGRMSLCHIHVLEGSEKVPLDPRKDLRNHSPTGFEWGYGGSGPSQTALALCADVLQNDQLAVKVYQMFKREVVTQLGRTWTLTEKEIREVCDRILSLMRETNGIHDISFEYGEDPSSES